MENTDNSPINELPKHKLDQESRIEMWSLIFLGLATLATAYAAWMGGVYGGNQSSYYMESNQKRAEGHASYLEAVNNSNNDSSVSKRINEIAVNYNIAKYYDDEQERLSCISATKLQFDLFSNSIYYEYERYLLDIKEAAEFFHLGEKKIRQMVDIYPNSGFAILNGNRVLIKRVKFQEFLDDATTI